MLKCLYDYMTDKQRKLKKLSIVGTVLFLILVSTYGYWKPKEELCFNGVRDKEEEGVDCGGVCSNDCSAPPKSPKVKNLQTEWVKFVKDGENNYDLIAKLSNGNSQWGISSVDYKFSVYDKNDRIVGARSGKTYTMPAGFLENTGAKYLVEDNFKTSEEIKKVDLEMHNFNWSEVKVKDDKPLAELNKKIIEVVDQKYGFVENGNEFYYAYGVTKNTSAYSFFMIDIKVVLFDSDDEPIAVGKTDQWTLGVGQGWEFTIHWKNPFGKKVDRAEFEAETNVFNSANFMKIYGTGRKYMIPK